MNSIGTANLSKPVIKPFSGNNKDYDPKEFILKLHLQLELRAVPEDVKALFVASFLEEKALRWYEGLDLITKRDFKLFEKAFLERFGPYVRKDTILDVAGRYHSLQQTNSVENYNQQFRDLVYLLPDNIYTQQAHLIKYIIGLKKMVGYEVRLRNCTTLEEAMDVAAKFEAAGDLQKVARKYYSIHQTTNVQNYNQQFRDLVYQLPDNLYPQQAHLIKYITGLKKKIGYEVRLRNCTTLEEAMDVAAKFEAVSDLHEKVYFRKSKRNEYP